MGRRKVWIQLDRATKELLRLNEMLAVVLQHVLHAALIKFPGAQMLRRFAARAIALGRADLRVQRAGDAVGDLILEREDVRDRPVESLRPDMGRSVGFNKLDRDAYVIGDPANAAFQDIS